MILKFNFILLNTLILIVLSFIIYNISKNKKAPKIINNIRKEHYSILKAVGIAFLIVIPLIFIQIFIKKDINIIGITGAIKI
jgi:hypothetical protein